MSRHRKRSVWIVIAVAAAALLGLVFRPSPLAVETGQVVRGALRVSVDEEGKTRVRDRFVVSAPVAGRLGRVELREGDAVERGGVIARLAPLPLDERTRAEANARLHAAIASERSAEARIVKASRELEQARRSHVRADELARTGTLASEAREQAELAEETLERDLESARFAGRAAAFEKEAARAALLAAEAGPEGFAAEVTVRAPVTGRILRLLQQSERSVSAGTPLVEIGDPASLEIVVDLLSADAVRVRPGAAMRIDAGDGGTLSGRVRTIEPSAFTKVSALGVEEQRVNVIADFMEPPGRLGDGYRVESSVTVWEADRAVKAPAAALFRRGSKWSVFVIEDGRARSRDVEVGHRNADEAEIVRGVDPGAVVILHRGDRVRDGLRVRPSG
jgi:HlyD family secretion protein